MDDFNPIPIADILDPQSFADKQTIMCVEGVIEKLFKVKRGQGNEGPYEFQNAILRDDTGEIKVSFANNTQPDAARGCVVRMTCYKSDQHGWTGVKVEDRGYNDRGGNWIEERQLKVTSTANVEYPQGLGGQGGGGGGRYNNGGGGGGGGYGGNQQRGGYGANRNQQQRGQASYQNRGNQQQQRTQQQNPDRNRPHNMSQPQKPPAQLPHPRLILDDLVALHKDIHTIVNDRYKEEIAAGLDTSGFLATIFIEAAKQGCVLDYRARAAKPPKKTYPPAPKDPNRWKECVLASGDFEGKTLEQVPDDYLRKLFGAFDEQGANHATAECVYKAAHDRGLIEKAQSGESDPLDTAPDDIPF